ncbi:spore coat protein [Paenibacillus hemerocallicola]|uniref:Spore coat protein n=1 Tax=Paenibacillus hemerocallicola TaxID=1172614 RepID=A0A5C4SVA9_9BACL|nr:spore coat protein [Paenibacillus hemerocallicola]TNJ54796.1 spore coat protein [Paenibacillus hemerocallicola]
MTMDYLDPAEALNMPEKADMTFAMDFLIRTKDGVRNTAFAITETASPEARALLRAQLHQGIALHQEISELMIRKKWFHPYELQEQFQLDMLGATQTMDIAKLQLFPDDTRRKGMFDRTPDEHMGGHQA